MSQPSREFRDALEQAKLDAMKELAYGASHEINNPLANISARAQTLLRNEADPERRRALEAIQHQAMRAHEMISDLMLFARPPRLEVQAVKVTSLLEQVQSELSAECRRREVEFQVNSDSSLATIQADDAQLAVAIKAICLNAIESIGRRGRVEVTAQLTDDGHKLSIAVPDDGPGISAATRPHIFEPFYSGREAGRGLGFGLSKCWRIVTAHGGSMSVEENSDRGAAVTISLPVNSTQNGPNPSA